MPRNPQVPKRKLADSSQLFLQQAWTFHQQGNLDVAKNYYEKSLIIQPNNFNALQAFGALLIADVKYFQATEVLSRALKIDHSHALVHFNLGIALQNIGQFDESLLSYENAISIEPGLFGAWLNKGGVLHSLQRHQDALLAYEQALKMKPDYSEAWSSRSSILNSLGRFEEGLSDSERALQINPNFFMAWSNKALSLNSLQRHEDALFAYERALEIKPDYAEAWSNRGAILNSLRRFEEGLVDCNKALQINPNISEAWANSGVALNSLMLYEESLYAYEKALQIKSDSALYWLNIGGPLNSLRRYEAFLSASEAALEINPHFPEAWFNKGVACYRLHRYEEASYAYNKALQIKPEYADVWFNKGAMLAELKDYRGALNAYQKASEFELDEKFLPGILQHLKMVLCDWSDFDFQINEIVERASSKHIGCTPFVFFALSDDPRLQKSCAETFANKFHKNNKSLGHIQSPAKKNKNKIKIGYFSADFKSHPVSFATVEMYELHDKSEFEIIGFSFGSDDKSVIRERVSNAFDQFINVATMSDREVASLSRELGINIAINLVGFTENCRTDIFAHRAAPIQVSYIGYLGTMGIDYMDYLIADEVIIPEGSEKYYSEKIIRLPSYQSIDTKRKISEKIYSRSELDLPSEGFIFAAFNNNYKILPATFKCWMSILKTVEDSILWIYVTNSTAASNLKDEAERYGVDATRIIFASSMPQPEHLARYKVADLFLDTFPCNGGSTVIDALWAGLPVLTLTGNSFASRVAASSLRSIGLPELITVTQEQYNSLAIHLATNPDLILAIKKKLNDNRLTTNLFDSVFHTKKMEAAYKEIFERYEAGLAPDHINIK
jgi:predicted O-linked N-acetylglucosamine transferase (SPINDLY family)